MKAVILIGGFGTRLRPLTLSVPKPLVEFCNKPIVLHQIEALKECGVKEIVLAINYQPEVVHEYTSHWESQMGIKIHLVKEDEPLGTAGCIANCRSYLEGNEPFFVLNADITCDFPFKPMLEFHKTHGGHATMLVKQVEDWNKYGVVVYDQTGKIKRFVEKPKVFVGNEINAGIYLFDPCVLNRLPNHPSSIEKDVFPSMASDGWMYCYHLPSFWADLGTPRDFISGTKYYLQHLMEKNLIHPSAKIGKGCSINNSVIGQECVIEDNVKLQDSVILEKSTIGSGSYVDGSIIGWQCKVKKWCHLYNNCVLGQDVTVEEGLVLNNTYVLPHKSISENVLQENKIVM